MKQELQNQLKEAFPQIFCDLRNCDHRKSLMCAGLEIGDGWYNLVYDMCDKIIKTNPNSEFKAVQVKQKFGGLRFYTTAASDEVHKIIDEAEQLSYKICEDCGSTENVESGWITLCKNCRRD